jgi:hypothetical protein
MVDSDCTFKKSGLTPGTPEVYVVPAPHMAPHRVTQQLSNYCRSRKRRKKNRRR